MTAESLQVTAPSDTELALVRRFDAPRHLVFDAMTKPELLKRWFGARGWHLIEAEVDLRVGGSWRFVSRGPGGEPMGHGGIYQEVARPDRLVYTERYDDQWVEGETLVTAVFVEVDEQTTVTTTLRYPSREVRDTAVASPMERGVGESYARLDAVLAEIRRPG